MFKLNLKKDEHITQTEKKYFNVAIDYAIKNNISNVKVNKIKYFFDFDKKIVEIIGTCKDWNGQKIINRYSFI